FMQLAIAEARKCAPVETAYNVGAVLPYQHRSIVATGYSRELPGNTHAEECCLLKLSSADQDRLAEAISADPALPPVTMYTTMEPCARRLSGRPSCTHRLLAAPWIRRIVLGVREPPAFVEHVDGIEQLRAAGRVVDVLSGWEQACL
ncbi:diaminohydroxyphosphoribosylamino-pyrimidine deaminase, partial [Syncephalis pseudoplumigaleata]